MENSFFKSALVKEQSRRHLNLIYNLYSLSIEDYILRQIMEIRSTSGYSYVFNYVTKAVFTDDFRIFLEYLKKRYNVDDTTFVEIIGLKEINFEIKSPGAYTNREDFILMLQLLMVSLFVKFNQGQIDFLLEISFKFGYKREHLIFIQEKLNHYLQFFPEYNNHNMLETSIINDFIVKFGPLPEVSHG